MNQQFTRIHKTGGVSAAGKVFSKSRLGRDTLKTEGWPDSEGHYSMKAIESLEAAEGELTERMVEIKDERIALVETIPGVGKLTSRVLVSAIDNADRFDNKKSVAKYGAVTPRVYQSGGITHLGRISQDGRHEVRRVLLQCAHTRTRMKSYEAYPLKAFFERIKKRRGKKIAIVAVARKLSTIAYGVLKAKAAYNPARLAIRAV